MQKDNNIYFNESGHLSELSVAAYVNALLVENVENLDNDVLDHVEECKECKSTILENYRNFKNLDKLESEMKGDPNLTKAINLPDSKNKKDNRFPLFLKIAATVVIVLSLGYLIMKVNLFDNPKPIDKKIAKDENIEVTDEFADKTNETENDENQDGVKDKKEITEEEEKEKADDSISTRLLAQNFEESPNLERFVNLNVRNNQTINVISPEISKEFKTGDTIEFKWNGADTNEPLTLKILTNKEEIIKEVNDIHNNIYTLNDTLGQGLYYWKLETEADLLYTGKFIIK